MEKSIDKCPYLTPVINRDYPNRNIRDDYELQYNDEHIVEEVKVGETDLDKEINSHVNEVGLINVFKNAIAHGEDPMVVFGKTEAGVPASVPNNATMDDLIELSNQNKAKYGEIAKSLGVSYDELMFAVQNGTLDSLINKPKEEVKDGE